ncbi:MAG: glycosyltransferase, partial [Sedimentisphaerales bacterium]|nr:glycosyltransferase [Sedimentisphaerales bacterium]
MNIDRISDGRAFSPIEAQIDLSNAEQGTSRFSFIMIVLNGMPFIEYSLKSVYDFAHEIIIVEGAVENCMFAANSAGGSTDGSAEFIESFPDPQNKIKLIRGRWPEKCEMQNEALKHVTGNYVWLIDSDEVYKKEDIEKIKRILRSDPSITQVNFIPDNFWKGLDYIFVSSRFFEGEFHCRRLFKYVPGAVFTTHRPPTMVWPGHDRTTEQMNPLDGTATREMGIVLYHYGYVLDGQVKQKVELYRRYGWDRHWKLDLGKWYEECFLKWTPENRQEIDSEYPIWTGDINSRTQLFNGTHPEVMKDFGKEPGRKEYWPEGHSLSVIGKTDYQKKVLDAWRYIKIDAPLQSRRRVMTENMEQGRSFWNIHVALAFLADRLRPQNYLEVGVRTGGSLIPLVHNCDVKEVVGVDMWSANYSGLYNSMEYTAGQISRYKTATGKRFEIELIKGDSHSVLKDLIASGRRFSLITVDGDHSEAGAWEDLQDAVELLGDEGAIVFDDIIHPDHLFLNGLVDRLVEKYPFFQVLINSEQDNGCAVFLKKIDPAELLQERGVEASHSKTGCNEPVVGGELPIATDISCGAKVKNILWVRTDSIGDAVLSASMLPHIREKYNDAKITVVCQEHIAELYEACPDIDEIVAFNKKQALEDEYYREEIIKRLRALKADLSVNSVYSREALTDWFALKCGAKRSVALEGNLCNIPRDTRDANNRLYTKLLASGGEHKTELERHEDFLKGLGIEATGLQPTIWTRPSDEEFAERIFRDNRLAPARTIALFAGAQYDCRVYERYGEALAEFCRANRLEIVALGTGGEEAINQRNLDAAGVRAVNLSGQTSILESAAVLKRCRLALGAETGLAHICCAVGTPNIILLGGGHFGRF